MALDIDTIGRVHLDGVYAGSCIIDEDTIKSTAVVSEYEGTSCHPFLFSQIKLTGKYLECCLFAKLQPEAYQTIYT